MDVKVLGRTWATSRPSLPSPMTATLSPLPPAAVQMHQDQDQQRLCMACQCVASGPQNLTLPRCIAFIRHVCDERTQHCRR